MSFGYDPEMPAGFQDADFEMRELQEEARRVESIERKVHRLIAEGRKEEAARLCEHRSHGYSTPGLAAEAENDPRAKEHGYRCTSCGSFLDSCPWENYDSYRVIAACEIEVKG